MTKRLASLGYSSFFADQVATICIADSRQFISRGEAGSPLVPYRVATRARNRLLLLGKTAEPIWADMRGRLYKIGNQAAVGDWVLACTRSDGDGVVEHVLDRQSSLTRQAAGRRTESQVIAANLDIVFVVASANSELNVRRLERYLTAVWDGGCTPVVVINKTDLGNVSTIRERLAGTAKTTQVVYSCAKSGDVEALRALLAIGKTAAFVGSSGVGKSTLINALYGHQIQKTGKIREDDDRGRHTTTARELIVTKDIGLLIDTPGMRELALWEGEQGILQAFSDIEKISDRCRFRNCAHAGEPGCAVTLALASGELATERFNSYANLKEEIATHKDRRHGGHSSRANSGKVNSSQKKKPR